MNTRHASVLLSFCLVACGGLDTTPVAIEDVSLTFFRSFAPGLYVFRSQTELETAWAAAPFEAYPIGIITEEPSIPAYDFSKYTVIGLSRGIGKWCFKQNFTTAFLNGANLVVHYQVPATSTLACLRDGPLISFALVPQFQGTVEFVQDGL